MKPIEVCKCNIMHEDIVNQVKEKLPVDDEIIKLAEFYKSFADTTRLKIISALLQSEMCVCDLSSLINASQSAVSHQLRILRQARLVKYRKEGKVVYYSLDDDHVKKVIEEGLNHIKHD